VALAAASKPASAHQAGPVKPPRAPPNLSLTLQDESATTLHAVLAGRITAAQLMFTSCQATCPIQGALFGEASKLLGARLPKAQLLSISIDPSLDDPAALRAWLKRFGAAARWRAARPEKTQLESLIDFLKSQKGQPDPHSAQCYFFNANGELVQRSVEFLPAKQIVAMLEQMAS